MDLSSELIKLIMANVDVLLVIGAVALIQALKKTFTKFPTKAWMLVVIAFGFLMGWIKVPIVRGHIKDFIEASLKYAAVTELLYQGWRTIISLIKAKIGKGK